jgi:hypothetical protein
MSDTLEEAVDRWNTRNGALPDGAARASEPDDWRDDPSSDERWNAGVDLVMMSLCDYLGVDPHEVTWDAATETVDGDISAVIGNILRTKFGEGWGPSDGAIYAAVSNAETPEGERAETLREIDSRLGDLAQGKIDPATVEACAKIAEAQKETFLSPQYASNQPFGSLCERFACDEVAKAIRALAIPSTPSADPMTRPHLCTPGEKQ